MARVKPRLRRHRQINLAVPRTREQLEQLAQAYFNIHARQMDEDRLPEDFELFLENGVLRMHHTNRSDGYVFVGLIDATERRPVFDQMKTEYEDDSYDIIDFKHAQKGIAGFHYELKLEDE